MRLRFKQRAWFTFGLLAFALVIFGFTLGLGRVARMVPLAVVLPTLLLLLVQLLMDMRPGLAQAYRRWEQKDLFQVEPLRKQASQQMEKEDMERRQGDRERQAFFWLLAMLALLYFLGFLVALPLYTLWYLRQHSEGWLKPMVIAAGIAGFVYGVSILDPGASLYGGWLGHWLGR